MFFFKPKKMTEAQIRKTIQDFGQAARRSVEAGVDGLQIHAAHGYLVNQFLSPFTNDRDDDWGGSDENRFRFLKEIVLEVQKEMPEGMPLLVKMNSHDHTPEEGITPLLAAKQAAWLAELGIGGLEVSGGTQTFSGWDIVRGDLPVDELASGVSWWMRPVVKAVFNAERGKHDLEEGYNLEGAKVIRSAVSDVPLFLVGGMRRVSHMEEILEAGYADFVSMCRPFIREPYFVKHIREGKTEVAACESCNKCAAAQALGMPVRCYATTGFPQ
jgi:2,4-dienoyl-CoA reductase-like NADH-dependent reductase (Old Yellow Enzyme family)